MSIASCSLHFAVQCFYLQFRPQSSTGDKDVFPLPVTGICPPPLLPHHYEHGKILFKQVIVTPLSSDANGRGDCDAVAMTTSFWVCLHSFPAPTSAPHRHS